MRIFNKLKIALFFILVFPAVFSLLYGHSQAQEPRKLIMFYSPTCHKCAQVKDELMPDIEKKFKDKILVEYRDITDMENYKLLLSLKEKYNAKDIKNVSLIFYFEGYFLSGQGQIEKNLEAFIAKLLNKPAIKKIDLLSTDLMVRLRPSMNSGLVPSVVEGRSPSTLSEVEGLIAHFMTFKPLAIISAGLIDGINPCAFTVMVFFISFLTLQGYRKKELIIIGLCFIFSVFLTYILIGIGIFGFLYRLASFWLAAKVFNFSIGIFSIILGTLALYDFLKFKKTESTEGLTLQLPKAVKNQIHSLIGLHYRKSKDSEAQPRILIFRLVLSALITGFLVSILEAVCTGQTYLPTISFILKTTSLKLPALGYLLLYNLMFILPLLVIFLFALWGVTSEQFARLLKKHLLSIKILMAILFFGLGIFLIWRA